MPWPAAPGAFVIQWAMFIPALHRQTGHTCELTGGLTYITITAAALALSPDLDPRSVLLATLVLRSMRNPYTPRLV